MVNYIIYNTPAAILMKDITHYLRCAQSVIIPVLTTPIDMCATTLFIQNVLTNKQVISKQCRVALIENRCKKNTNIYQQLGIYIKKVLETQNYNKTLENGQGISELLTYLAGRDLGQWKEFTKWLKSKRSQLEN